MHLTPSGRLKPTSKRGEGEGGREVVSTSFFFHLKKRKRGKKGEKKRRREGKNKSCGPDRYLPSFLFPPPSLEKGREGKEEERKKKRSLGKEIYSPLPERKGKGRGKKRKTTAAGGGPRPPFYLYPSTGGREKGKKGERGRVKKWQRGSCSCPSTCVSTLL